MNTFFTKSLYCFLLVCFSAIATAQTKYFAAASPEKVGRDEYITYKLTIENASNVQQVNPPSFSDFNVVGGPSQESAVNNINGVVTQSVSVNYILQAKKPGNFTIPPSTAIINGKAYKSNPVKIFVSSKKILGNQPNNTTPSMQSPFAGLDLFDEPKPQAKFDDYILRNGETVPEKVNRNMQLKLQTSKASCYVGEPILATYKLYTRLQSESNLSKNPSFNGFSVVDMMQQVDQNSYSKEMLNGREYNVYLIRKAQLYPLQAGFIELEAATLDNKITFVKYENGMGNDGTMFSETVSLSSKPATINVLPLPEKNKPANFDGAVGDFTIDATVEKNNFSTDESGKLLITISGSGNMQLLTAPEIDWPQGFEIFETKSTDNTNTATIPLSGSKMFEIPFTISAAGNYVIPSIGFSYFDPHTRSYKTASSKAISLSITKGSGIISKSVANTQKEPPLSLLNRIFAKRWLVILLLVWMILTGIVVWMRRERKNENKRNEVPVVEKNVAAAEIPVALSSNRNYLEKTEACLARESCIDFYILLNDELKAFFASKYQVAKTIIDEKSLGAAMDKFGVNNDLILQTQALLSDIAWQLYTPFERNEQLNKLYAKAQTIIQQHLLQAE